MSTLRNRNFSILWAGQLVSTFGNSLYFIAIPWYVYTLTHSKADLALTGMAQTLPMLAGLFTGVFVDRWSKRWTMVGSDLIRVVLALVLFGVVMAHGPFYVILTLVLLLQFVGTFFNPASGALIPLLVSEQDVPAAAGFSQSASAVAQLLGTAFGGALMAFFGAPWLFLIDAFTFAVSVCSLLFIRVQEPRRPGTDGTTQHSFFQEWAEGFHLFRQYKFFLLILASAMLANFAMAPVDVALTAWVQGPMHGNAFDLGIINAAFFVGVISGGITLGIVSKHFQVRQILMHGMVGSGVLTIGMGLWANLAWDALLLVIVGFLIGSLNGAVSAMAMQIIPETKRGRVFATMGAMFTLTMPLGMALFGTLMVHIPLSILFTIMGSLSVVSGLSYLLPVHDDTQAVTTVNSL